MNSQDVKVAFKKFLADLKIRGIDGLLSQLFTIVKGKIEIYRYSDRDLYLTIKALNKKYHKGFSKVLEARDQWSSLHRLTLKVFLEVKEQVQTYEFVRPVSIIDSRKNSIGDQYVNWNYIMLEMDRIPIGIIKKNYHLGELPEFEHQIEDGGVVCIAQGPSGQVSIIIKPSSSEFLKFSEDFIIFKLYRMPCYVREKDIWNAVKFMFILSIHSSFISQNSLNIWDSFKIFFVSVKSKLNNFKVLGFEALKGLIYSLAKLVL